MSYRLSSVEIFGLRTLDHVRLDLRPGKPVVLIGENGSGKSTILEAFEILRRTASPNVLHEISTRHGGLVSLVRQGETFFRLRVQAESTDAEKEIVYDVSFYRVVDRAVLLYEFLTVDGGRTAIVERGPGGAKVRGGAGQDLESVNVGLQDSVLAIFRPVSPHWAITVMRELLERIEVHPPMPVVAPWATDRGGAGLREAVIVEPTDRLEPLGANLPNAYHCLMNEFGEDHRRETLDLIRLGLGDHVESVATRADAGGGRHSLTVKYRHLDRPIPSHALSDGTLTYLALVALIRLGSRRSLMALDEPDLHLHPAAVARVVSALEALSEEIPVLIATQSDVVLDCLEHPAESAVLCQLDPAMRTVLVRPDAAELASWLEDYRGLGDLRSQGYEKVIMSRPQRPEPLPSDG